MLFTSNILTPNTSNLGVIMKSIIIFLQFAFCFESAFSNGYYGRFWRGYEKQNYSDLRNYCDDRHSDCFLELINRWLIPATPSYAAKTALMSYAPVLLPIDLKNNFHHEVALILYDTEEKYRTLRSDRSNIEGSTYSPIHRDIFEMGTKGQANSSRSLVPIPFSSKIELKKPLNEVSYDLLNQKNDLINSRATFFIFRPNTPGTKLFLTNLEKAFSEIQDEQARLRLLGAYALVTTDYVMIYIFEKTDKTYKFLEKLAPKYALKKIWHTNLKQLHPIQSNPLLYERIGYGEGGNLNFTPGSKPGLADHYRLWSEFQ